MADEEIVLNFEVHLHTLPGEIVGLTGDTDELGNWNPENSIFLKLKQEQPDGFSVWICELKIPSKALIKYRYFTCLIPDSSLNTGKVIISRWEDCSEPRVWNPTDNSLNKVTICDTFGSINNSLNKVTICDTFGSINGYKNCLSKGWLTMQTEVNLRLVPGCITLRNKDLQIAYIKCTPFEMGSKISQGAVQPWSQVLTYTLNETDYIPKLQDERNPGCSYHPNDVMIFKIQVLSPDNLAFKFDFFEFPSKSQKGLSLGKHIGYSCILPSELKDSLGHMTTFVSSVDQKLLGEFKVRFSIIRPLVGVESSLNVSYRKSLNYKTYPINIGHRGMGSSFNITAPVMENTIASFNAAAQYGAQCVEMDVHLTKDLEPVIYHDFSVHVAMEKKDSICSSINNHAQMSIKNLTLDQLQTLKLFYHIPEASQWISISDGDNRHELPFPTLLECLNEVNEDLGFSVEFKYPSQMETGEYEDNTMFDANQFCDVILSLLLKHCGNRKIILSTFEPDLCVMLHLKQNKFPVMFLTQGQTKTWPPYKDLRTQTVETGIRFTKAENLFGICALTENLLKDKSLIETCHSEELNLLCWGIDNDNHENLKTLAEKGLTGIIYNRMDVYGPGAMLQTT